MVKHRNENRVCAIYRLYVFEFFCKNITAPKNLETDELVHPLSSVMASSSKAHAVI